MSTTTQDITAAEWLDVRDRVADEVKGASSSQPATRVGIAEKLLRAGFIDIDAVLATVRPQAEPDRAPTTRVKEEQQ